MQIAELMQGDSVAYNENWPRIKWRIRDENWLKKVISLRNES